MKKLFIFFALSLSLAQAQVTIPVIKQTWSRAGVTNSGWPKTPVSGDPFVACWSTQGSLTGISDGQSNTFTQITTISSGSPTTVTTCWKATFSASSADTITVTGSFSNTQMLLAEFDKNLVTATVDGSNSGSYSGTPGSVTTSSTTSFYNSMYFAFVVGVTNTSFLPTSPLILTHVLGNQNNSASAYMMAGAPGTKNGVFTLSGNVSGNWIAFALKPVSMVIYDTSIPTAIVNTAYRFQPQVLNGTAAPTFSVSSGNLPAGLTLNSTTGVISGTPTGVTRTFTLQATDGTTTVSQSYTLTVHTTAATPTEVSSVGYFSTTIGIGSLTAGDVIIVTLREDVTNGSFGHSVIPPTDACGSTYVYTGAARIVNQAVFLLQYMAIAASTATCTITPNASDTFTGAEAMSFHNVQGFFDNSVFTTGTTGTTWTSNSISTNATNSMVFVGVTGTSGTYTAGSGYTLGSGYGLACTTTCTLQHEYGVQATEGAYTPTITGPSANWWMSTTALRAGTSVASTVVTYHRAHE